MMMGVFIILFALGIGAAMYCLMPQPEPTPIAPLEEIVVERPSGEPERVPVEEINDVSDVNENEENEKSDPSGKTESNRTTPSNALQRARQMSLAIRNRKKALAAKAQSDALRQQSDEVVRESENASKPEVTTPILGSHSQPNALQRAKPLSPTLGSKSQPNALQRAREIAQKIKDRKKVLQTKDLGAKAKWNSLKTGVIAGKKSRRHHKSKKTRVKLAKEKEKHLADNEDAPSSNNFVGDDAWYLK